MRAARGAYRVLVTAALVLACEERAPYAPPLDAGRWARDSGTPFDASEPVRPGRPDGGPILPAADLELVLPYLGAPVVVPLDVEEDVGRLDVFFSIDTTGSFGGEIDNLQRELRSSILPALRERVADVAFGVGRFQDFPELPFGEPGDVPFELGTAITTDDSRVFRAVAALDQPLGSGGDLPEASAEALYQIATGAGYGRHIAAWSREPARGGGTLGGVGFRDDSLRVVVHVTDAPTHEPADYGRVFPGTRSTHDAIEALEELGVRVLGIASSEAARAHLETVALGTGAAIDPRGGVCSTGIDGSTRPARDGRCPLVFDVRPDGTGLAEAIVDAIADLLATVRYAEVWGESDDALGFVRAIEALEADSPDGIAPPAFADLRPADGLADTFVDVGPGTRLRFGAQLRNASILPADYDQIFNIAVRIVGDGVTLVARRIRVIVPRGRLDAGALDGGGAADAG